MISAATASSCPCVGSILSSSYTPDIGSRRVAAHRLLDISHSLMRAGQFFSASADSDLDASDSIVSSRIRKRADQVSRLLNDAMKQLKLLGIDKNAPIASIDGKAIGLQEFSRLVGAFGNGSSGRPPGSDSGTSEGHPGSNGGQESGVHPAGAGAIIVVGVYTIGKFIAAAANGAFNGTEDDEARKLVSLQSDQQLQQQSDPELVRIINVLLDGPTGDDDERTILRILETSDCARRRNLVNAVGLNKLLGDIDGDEWDRLVILLEACGIVSFDRFDDDASRRFVNSYDCSQLGRLGTAAIRQLVLNMFSGSCGDDDEDAILSLLRCQSTAKLQQLVGMPGTGVDAFDYNFDGSQWYDLESLFATHGIVLDP